MLKNNYDLVLKIVLKSHETIDKILIIEQEHFSISNINFGTNIESKNIKYCAKHIIPLWLNCVLMTFEELPYLAVFDIVDNKMLSMIDLNKTGDFNKKQESIMNFQSLFNTSH